MERFVIEDLINKCGEDWIEELKVFLAIESVSNKDLMNMENMYQAIEAIKKQLSHLGFEELRTIQTSGYPLLYADNGNSADKMTILIYGHYDVQPAGDAYEWISEAFMPEIREGRLYARGATDNKGQLWILVKSLEVIKAVYGEIPFNIKFLIEGEEEVGSTNVYHYIEDNSELLECDFVLISDTAMLAEDAPSICYGLRGGLGFTLTATGPNKDLHSGSFFGGAVQNPIFALITLIQTMKSANGKITIESFYEGIENITEQELKQFNNLPFNIDALKESIEVEELVGEPGYTYFERIWSRPTLEVVSMCGGDAGKSAIPSIASANIMCRLVPGQDPYRLEEIIKQHIQRYSPPGVKIDADFTTHIYPYCLSLDEPLLGFAQKAYKKAFESEVSFIRAGGSIPLVELMNRQLKVPIIMMGFSHPNANVHGPNEYISLDTFSKGVQTLVYFYKELYSHYAR